VRSQPLRIPPAFSRSFGPAGRGPLLWFLWGILVLVSALAGIAAPPGADVRGVEARLGELVRDRVSQRNGCRLQMDPELCAAAREWSELVAAGVVSDGHELLRSSLSARGILDPFPYVFYGSAPPERFDEIETRLRAQLLRLPEAEAKLYTHLGVGLHEHTTRRYLVRRTEWFVTVLLTQRAVSFSPLPGDPRPRERFLFEGEVYPPYREPKVLLTRPDGNTEVLENYALEPRRFRTYLCFGTQPGEYQLEVMGRYDMGPRVLGLASLWLRDDAGPSHYDVLLAAARHGTLQPTPPRPSFDPPRDERQAEEQLLALLNRDRNRAGAGALQELPELSRVARSHSTEMRDRGYFAHVSPRTGRLVDRAEDAGIAYRRIGENIAVGGSVEEAQEALMRSPGHRMNLLDPEFSHVGVGVAFDVDSQGRRRVFVTENFLVPPP